MAHLEALLGSEVIGQNDSKVSVATLVDNDLLGIYFSAHWCNPCQNFTSVLADCYKKLKESGKKLEVIFISLDKDEESCREYYKSMPWLLFPFESDLKDKNANKSEQLSEKYGVTGIPSLILLDPKSGDLISDDGQGLVENDPNGENFPWK